MAVGTVCYIIGKYSYKDELRRRVETSPLTTPYMQGLRRLMGIPSPIGEFDPTSEPSSFDNQSTGWNAGTTLPSGYYPPQQPPPAPFNGSPNRQFDKSLHYRPSDQQPEFSSQSLDGNDQQQRTLTYDELRDRNRGHTSR